MLEYSIFSPEKLKSLKYNVFAVPEGDSILEAFPELAAIESFQEAAERGDINNLIKFIVAMYDKKSPAVKTFQDIEKRKKECAALAGYDVEVDERILKGMFDFTDNEFAAMVIDFLKDQNSRVWSMIVSNEQTFFEYQNALLREVTISTTDKDRLGAIVLKSKLMQDSDDICGRLDKYYQQLFGDEITGYIEADYSPEGQAKRK